MSPKPPSPGPSRQISRRQFARDAVLAGATAALLPSAVLAQQQETKPEPVPPPESAAQLWAKLPRASQDEVEAKYQAVVRRYGARFTEAQKSEVRRQLIFTQKALDTLRAFPLENSDAPATVFRPYRRPASPARPAPRAGKP